MEPKVLWRHVCQLASNLLQISVGLLINLGVQGPKQFVSILVQVVPLVTFCTVLLHYVAIVQSSLQVLSA
jgi:hypothetical protein